MVRDYSGGDVPQKAMLSSANSAGNIPPGKKLTGGKRRSTRKMNRKRHRKNSTVWV
jgi:hypothetical protein